jgi:YD repeat-containing protein
MRPSKRILGAATRLIYRRVCGRSEDAERVANSAVVSQFNYTYNAVGDILTWTQANSGLTDPQQYALGYDNVDQLTSATLTDTVTSATLGQQAFTYDLNGNTISSGPSGAPTSTYGWDAADRLISVTQGANVTTYDYDGLGAPRARMGERRRNAAVDLGWAGAM